MKIVRYEKSAMNLSIESNLKTEKKMGISSRSLRLLQSESLGKRGEFGYQRWPIEKILMTGGKSEGETRKTKP